MPELPLAEMFGVHSDDEAEPDETVREHEADAFAAALAMEQAPAHPKLARAATEYFRAQIKLLQVQLEHQHEQRELNVGHLRARRVKDRVQISLQLVGALVAAILGIALLLMIYDALRSRSVVVEPFETPAAISTQGLSGRVVASQLLDALSKIQEATRSAAVKRHIESAWTHDIKIEVPETGISIGEIDKLLRERLGHDQHVSGNAVLMPAGNVKLSVRGDGMSAKSFSAPIGSLDALITQAAEYIYGSAEPILFGSYLLQSGRNSEAESFAAHSYPTVRPKLRADMADLWGTSLLLQGKYPEAVLKHSLAIQSQPRLWRAWGNLVGALVEIKNEEEAAKVSHQMHLAAASSGATRQPSPANWVNSDIVLQDLPDELAHIIKDSINANSAGTAIYKRGPGLADVALRMHDWRAVEGYLAGSDPDDSSTKAERLFAEGYRAIEEGNPAAAVAPLEAFYAPLRADSTLAAEFGDGPCLLGLAYELTGRRAEASKIFDATGPFVSCRTFLADGLDNVGDWIGAQTAYAAAVALAPDLSLAYDHWGLALMRHGRIADATAKFILANAKSPHWADPLKHWGDALARRGQWSLAKAKYQAALRFAPAWSGLKDSEENAARKAASFGRPD